VERLQADGLESLCLDVCDSVSIQSSVKAVLDRTNGRLDALFNNAGYGQPGAVEDISREALREQFETNLFGALELTNQVIPAMRRQGAGRIVYNSSVLGLVAFPYRGAYVASKFAMEGLADTLRLELAGTGIHICLIEPGPIMSRFRAHAYAAYQRHVCAENSPHQERYAPPSGEICCNGGPVAQGRTRSSLYLAAGGGVKASDSCVGESPATRPLPGDCTGLSVCHLAAMVAYSHAGWNPAAIRRGRAALEHGHSTAMILLPVCGQP